MATTGSERGLTLRSPGRFTADRARASSSSGATRGASADPRLARRGRAQAWIDAEAYRLYTLRTVTRLDRRRERSARESSLNKVFWSELDVRLHETALRAARARRRARRRGAGADAWMKGYQFALVGPDLRGHQRDPAQRDRRARARPARGSSRRCASPSPTSSSRSATPCATCSRRSARRDRCATRGRARRGGLPGVWAQLGEMGVLGLLCRRGGRRPRPRRARPRPAPRGDGLRRVARAGRRARGRRRAAPGRRWPRRGRACRGR